MIGKGYYKGNDKSLRELVESLMTVGEAQKVDVGSWNSCQVWHRMTFSELPLNCRLSNCYSLKQKKNSFAWMRISKYWYSGKCVMCCSVGFPSGTGRGQPLSRRWRGCCLGLIPAKTLSHGERNTFIWWPGDLISTSMQQCIIMAKYLCL